ncbi:hypothetical protein MTBBW1_1980004 [Desulfamplus magnetovallimortis]|uniref:Uncharacterized protein n=1 Tax=Desulfamplus magnetovallimortis TaxID=1246637 RepID=A0A1W1HBK6_9BACT|nr:hypothetical protein [Desulfamplus magnetovallimortis]SLM29782.1 hypothetical protein MTBBW1_1980004 [Desulfamplus magnetovallimortis]
MEKIKQIRIPLHKFVDFPNPIQGEYGSIDVYHLELTDNLNSYRILGNLMAMNLKHPSVKTFWEDEEYMPGLYIIRYNSMIDIFFIIIFSPEGTVHVLCNDMFFAYELAVSLICKNREYFDQSLDSIEIKEEWTRNTKYSHLYHMLYLRFEDLEGQSRKEMINE